MKILLKCILLLSAFLPATGIHAKTNTPIETFINHVRENTAFVPVSNIWQPDNTYDKTAMLQKVQKAQPLTIDYAHVAELMQHNYTAISLVVPGLDGSTYTIDLAQYKFLSNDFQVHVKGTNSDELYNYIPGVYYSGVVHGIPGSVATFSFFHNEVYGIFSIPGVGNFNIVPNVMVGKYYNYNEHYVVYNDNDLKIKDQGPSCATDRLPIHDSHSTAKTTTLEGDSVYNNCTQVNVFEVGDYALYQTKGSSVTNVTNYLTALFNNQSTLYRNEGILIDLKYVQVDNAVDGWNDITTANSVLFLDKFGYVTGNVLHGCDLAILASTCLNGGYGALGGVAWLQAMCQTYHASDSFGSYAFCDMDNSAVTNFPTFSWDVEVITHEMGHVVGSPHTHRCCWNPPGTGSTAIDGCYTLEGSCAEPVPLYPVGGGTIMSYCHLTSDGINFTNGFGQQPGDTVRYYIAHHFSSTCGSNYHPYIALSTANRTISANRECTDMNNGTTYYWYDNNTASQNDDTLVLMVKKNGNNIGTLDVSGFSVSANTIVRYGSGTGDTITSFPTGTPGISGRYYGMRRYWSMNATTAPTTPVEVIFPFLPADTSDVNGSVPGAALMANYIFYKANSPVNPNPIGGFTGATSSSFAAYTYSTTASATHFSITDTTGTHLAHMLMTNLSGGGTGMYAGCSAFPAPTPSLSATAPCTGTSNWYSVNPVAGALSYNWSISGTGWSGSSTTDSAYITTGSGVVTITVSANDTCGAGDSYSFTITPSAIPAETISAPSPLCAGTSTGVFSITATGVPTSYSWTVSGTGWSGSSSSSSITPVVGTGVGTLIVTGYNGCGAGVPDTLTVTPGTIPGDATDIVPPTALCSGSTGIFTTPSVTGATSYTWDVSGTGWSGTSSTSSLSATIGAGTGTITVTPVNVCGDGIPFTINGIIPTPLPTATFVESVHTTTTHTIITETYTGSAPGGSTYLWTFGGGTPASSTSAGPVSVYWNTAGTYTITLTVDNGGCTATYTDTIHVSHGVGIKELTTGSLTAGIVPNPNDGSFDVVFDQAITAGVTVKLYDMLGREVYKNVFTGTNNNKVSIAADNLPNGTYAATIYANDKLITQKITITR